MFRLSTLSIGAAALLTVAILVTLPNSGTTQQLSGYVKEPPLAVATATAQQKESKAQVFLRLLEDRIDTKSLVGQPVNLKQCLALIYDLFKNKKGIEFPLLVDVESFKAETPDMPDIYLTIIDFPPVPEELSIGEFLRHALGHVATKNATFVVMHDRVLILPYEKTTATAKLNEKVRGTFENRPLSSVLRELSERVGATIVIDTRALEKAKTEVSATFLNDIPLAGALRVLTEMAELKVVVLDGAILVTTPAHAEALRKEQKAKTPEVTPVVPAAPPGGGFGGFAGGIGGGGSGLPGVPGGFGGGLPGFPGAPGGNTRDDRIVDPLWPYDPSFGSWPRKEAK